jgi:hypothetical protein
MPITFTSNLQQAGRAASISADSFFHLVDGTDIDFSVEKILIDGDVQTTQTPGQKFIVASTTAASAAVPSITTQIPTIAVNDIVRWTGNAWELYFDASNKRTPVGLIYDKRTDSLYTYNNILSGWVPLLSRLGVIDGGTFT